MLADRRNDNADILRVGPPIAKEREGHESSRMGVVSTVDAIADIVHEAGDFGQLDEMIVITELLQDPPRRLGDLGAMDRRMIRIAHSPQDGIALIDIRQ